MANDEKPGDIETQGHEPIHIDATRAREYRTQSPTRSSTSNTEVAPIFESAWPVLPSLYELPARMKAGR